MDSKKPLFIFSSATAFLSGFFLAVLVFALLYAGGYVIPKSSAQNIATPLFSPGSEDDIILLIQSSQNTLDLEMYTFSNMHLADAIVESAGRGVKCRVMLEARIQGSDSVLKMANYLSSHGVEVRFASNKFTLTHSKLLIIDGKKVLVGSINFSNNAVLKNREAAVILEGPVANDYESIFNQDWDIASPSVSNT